MKKQYKRNLFNLQTDAEIQINKLKGELKSNTNKYGKKIAEGKLNKVANGNQVSYVGESTNFKTGSFKHEKDYTIETYVKKNEITTLICDGKYKAKGVSKCHPDDRFDLTIGIRIAEAQAYKNLMDLKIADYIKGVFNE